MSEIAKCPVCGAEIHISKDSVVTCLGNDCLFICDTKDLPSIAAAMESQKELAALREAVAWERECCQDIRPLAAWGDLYVRHGEDYVDSVAGDLREIQDAARAEVDRLMGEGE